MINKIKEKLKNKKVGIAGAGGLGSNCAVALARVGVGNLIIADFDEIEKSNLNRQYYFKNQIGKQKVIALKENILKIDPDINVEIHNIKLNIKLIVEIFKDCDIIVEAFDLAEMKQMLIETVLSEFPDKLLVVGIGMAGWGNSNSIKVRNDGNLYICGDEKTEVSENIPPLAPRVGIVANIQANTVIDLLLKE